MKMRILMILTLCVGCGFIGYSQSMELVHLDNTTNDNLVLDLIEDYDGNYVYVGACAIEGEDMWHNNGFICKIDAFDGRELKRHVEYCDEPYLYEPINDLRFQHIFLTKDSTYFVIGSKIVDGDGYIIVREFNRGFDLIMQNEAKISEDRVDGGTEVIIRAKSYGEDQYVLCFYYVQDAKWYGVTSICKLNRDGTLSNIQEVVRLNPNSGSSMVYNVVPINKGERFMVIHEWGYIIYDSEINLSEIVNFAGSTTYTDGDGCYFDNSVIYFCCKGYGEANWSIDIRVVWLDDLKYPQRLHQFGQSKTVHKYARTYSIETKACDYLTDDNLVFGGTFNSIPEGDRIMIHSLYPSILGVGSYNRLEDKINWECYYEDGEHCFLMTSICATRDGGAIVAATRASRDQALNYLSDIAIFKVSGTTSVKDLGEKEFGFSIYPNPATDRLTIDCDYEGGKILCFYDITGRLCDRVVLDEGMSKYDINIEHLRNGVYQLQMIGRNGMISTRKLVVRR